MNSCVEKYRSCEVECSSDGEVGLHQRHVSCRKNPGHKNFTPVDDFTLNHLPLGYRTRDLLKRIQALSVLTIRVTVEYVSENRPKTYPCSENRYPSSDMCGTRFMRTGSGWVKHVTRHFGSCKCKDCHGSSMEKWFAEIYIQTASHVVFDELEVQHTTCQLFFDRGSTLDLCPGVETFTKLTLSKSVTDRDICEMKYVTCDNVLIQRLEKSIEHYEVLEEKVCHWYHRSLEVYARALTDCVRVPRPKNVLAVIVSHPHGCSKQISLGYCTGRVDVSQPFYSELTYTTPTCSGSSGAYVFVLGNMKNDHEHIHAGCYESENLNHSCVGMDMFYYLQMDTVQHAPWSGNILIN